MNSSFEENPLQGNGNSLRALNLGMMVDGNARQTFIDVIKSKGLTKEDMVSVSTQNDVIEEYMKKLPETYLRNAKWCIDLGEELFKQTENSEYVIFVYNVANRARGHFKGIEYAICEAGGELINRLSSFGDVCLLGPESEKKHWVEMYPQLKDVYSKPNDHRTVILTGYQRGNGEDAGVPNVRHLDFFIRSTQMRFSGMFMPCMDNTHMITLSHMPYKYCASDIIQQLLKEKGRDEEHNEINVYSPSIYSTWIEHEKKPLSMYITTNALPPREHFFESHVPVHIPSNDNEKHKVGTGAPNPSPLVC